MLLRGNTEFFSSSQGIISLSQLIVCQCLAPVLSIYLSRDSIRTQLGARKKALSIFPIVFLLGVAFFERKAAPASVSPSQIWILLILVFLSVVISQSCARYVARNRSPLWSQPRLTLANAFFLGLVLWFGAHQALTPLKGVVNFFLAFFIGLLVLLVQRLYIFGLKKADPFFSAMTLCTIVPLSLTSEYIFENRHISLTEVLLATGYVLATAFSLKRPSTLGRKTSESSK